MPIENVHARVYGVSPYYERTFGVFGRMASATLATPIGWAHVEGDVQDVSSSVERFGLLRAQDPLASYQTHVVYNLSRSAWVAADFTYYDGGSTTVGGVPKNDRQNNTRGGMTLSVPCGENQSLKLTWAQGVSTRVGSSFRTVGLGWQWRWI